MFDLLFLSKPLFVLSFRDWPSSALASTMQRHPSCLAAPKRVRERERDVEHGAVEELWKN